MLEKQSIVKVNRTSKSVSKQTQLPSGTIVERLALETFDRLRIQDREAIFHVPMLVGKSTNLTQMALIRGFRLNDLLGLINELINYFPDLEVVRLAADYKLRSLHNCTLLLKYFQSQSVQSALQSAIGNYEENYRYREKMKETIIYILRIHGISFEITSLYDELNTICERLLVLPSVYFRDAILKNQIIYTPMFSRREINRISKEIIYGKVIWQKVGYKLSTSMRKFIEYVLGDIDHQNLCYNVDFEQISEKVAVVDDWNQIFTAQVFGLPLEYGINFVKEHLRIEEEDYLLSVIFRSLRAWSRRLFYRYEKPDQYLLRYRFETMAYHLKLATASIERLQISQGNNQFLEKTLEFLVMFNSQMEPGFISHSQASSKS
jgi:hypothetical protein